METSWQTSGSCLVAIKLCLAVVVCLSAMGYQSVQAAECTSMTDFKCVATDFTLETCSRETKLCDCQPGYVPIPTGCVNKQTPIRPVVRTDWGRTREFIPNSPVTLTCDTPEHGVYLIHWKNSGGGDVQASTSDTLILHGTGGVFTCSWILCSQNFTSEPVTISEVSPTGPAAPPVVAPLPEAAPDGAQITVVCQNIPHGATTTIKVDNITSYNMVVTHNKNISSGVCVIDSWLGANLTRNLESAPQPWTTKVVEDITSVTIQWSKDRVFTHGAAVSVTCATVPAKSYYTKMNYIFMDSLNPTSPTTNIGDSYTVTPTVGIHSITCTASDNNKPGKTSEPVTLTFSDKCVQPPVLLASETSVKLGTRLVLTCGDVQLVGGISYLWIKDGIGIQDQIDRTIQYGSYTANDAGKYVCLAFANDRYVMSEEVTVTSSAHRLQFLGCAFLLGLIALASSQNF